VPGPRTYELDVVDLAVAKGLDRGARLISHREADAVHVRLLGGDANVGAVLSVNSDRFLAGATRELAD